MIGQTTELQAFKGKPKRLCSKCKRSTHKSYGGIICEHCGARLATYGIVKNNKGGMSGSF